MSFGVSRIPGGRFRSPGEIAPEIWTRESGLWNSKFAITSLGSVSPGVNADLLNSHHEEITMNRIQYALTSFVAGLCVSVLGFSPTLGQEPVWNPIEAKSRLFNQQASPPAGKDAYPDTSRTVSKWQPPRISRALGNARPGQGEARGVRLTLVSFTNTSTLAACDAQQPPIVPVFTSVLGDTTMKYQTCSTNKVASPADSTCSVNTSANTQERYMCSTIAQPDIAYCSTGPNGTSDGSNGPSTCSTQGGEVRGARRGWQRQ